MEADDELKGTKNSYDFGARLYDPRVGRWLSRDPINHVKQSPYHYANNSPMVFSDPTGESGILTIVKDANGNESFVISANMHFYTGDPSLKAYNHNQVVTDMMKQFNSQNLEITVDGKTLPVKLELTSDLTYAPVFNEIKFDDTDGDLSSQSEQAEIQTKATQTLPGDKNDLLNNYVRLDKFGDEPSTTVTGTQSGRYTTEQMGKGSTTPLHEFMHSLGVKHPFLYDDKGKIIGFDLTTDAIPGDIVPLSYPTGTKYESTGDPINTLDRRPTNLETDEFIYDTQDLGGGNTQKVVGVPGYFGQVLTDKKGNNAITPNDPDKK